MDTNPEPQRKPEPIPLTRVEKIAIVGAAIAATAVLGLLTKNTLDTHLLMKRSKMHSGTILAILHTLEDQDIIQNLKFGE